MTDTILVPVDFSAITDAVVQQAARFGRALNARLELIHVITPEQIQSAWAEADSLPWFGPVIIGEPTSLEPAQEEVVSAALQAERDRLQQYQEDLEAEGLKVRGRIALGDTPAGKICEEAKSSRASLIVMGSHGHGALYHLLMGSVSEGVINRAPCPVLVVPP
ncbi:MAG: universal stress protein, partial [Phycisphaeraceae bacterium]